MISDLCGRACRWTSPWERAGVGIVRAVYADHRPDRVARVLVEVTEGNGHEEAGELLDLHIQHVKLAAGARP